MKSLCLRQALLSLGFGLRTGLHPAPTFRHRFLEYFTEHIWRISQIAISAVLGTLLDWRVTFWALALLCLPATFVVVQGILARTTTTEHESATGPALRAGIAQLVKSRLLLVNAATSTFLAPIVTHTAVTPSL